MEMNNVIGNQLAFQNFNSQLCFPLKLGREGGKNSIGELGDLRETQDDKIKLQQIA